MTAITDERGATERSACSVDTVLTLQLVFSICDSPAALEVAGCCSSLPRSAQSPRALVYSSPGQLFSIFGLGWYPQANSHLYKGCPLVDCNLALLLDRAQPLQACRLYFASRVWYHHAHAEPEIHAKIRTATRYSRVLYPGIVPGNTSLFDREVLTYLYVYVGDSEGELGEALPGEIPR